MAPHTLDWECFTIDRNPANPSAGALRCPYNNQDNRLPADLMVVMQRGGGCALRRGRAYLSIEPDNKVAWREKPAGPEDWELFDIARLPTGGTLPGTFIQQLNTRGWALVPVFSAAEAEGLKNLVSAVEGDAAGWDKPHQKRVHNVCTYDPRLLKVATHPLLVGILSKFMGENVRCATFSSNTLGLRDRPGDVHPFEANGSPKGTGLGWHVDYPYHDIKIAWPSVDKPLGCQMLVLLDEFTACNGGTMFRTGTHRLLRQPRHDYSTPPPSAESQCEQLGRLPPPHERPPGFVVDPNIMRYHDAPAGSVLLAHSAWWHRQVRNLAPCVRGNPRRRTALLGNYTPGFVVPKDDMRGQFESLLRWDAAAKAQLTARDKHVAKALWLGPSQRGGARRGNPRLGSL